MKQYWLKMTLPVNHLEYIVSRSLDCLCNLSKWYAVSRDTWSLAQQESNDSEIHAHIGGVAIGVEHGW